MSAQNGGHTFMVRNVGIMHGKVRCAQALRLTPTLETEPMFLITAEVVTPVMSSPSAFGFKFRQIMEVRGG